MSDFENTAQTKYRFRMLGKNKNGEEWYGVECKSTTDNDARWEGGLAGTSAWLGLTAQQIAWAK